MQRILLIFSFITIFQMAHSQEFPKGWVLYAEYFNGTTTQFHSTPDLYLTELRLTPQYTLIENTLRLGVSGGVQFNNKKFDGLLGPSLAFKIKTVSVKKLQSSVLNLQWIIENLWGTGKQQLIGTGLKAEIGQTLMLSVTGDRDFNLNYWRFQFGLGINLLSPPKVNPDPGKIL